MLVTVKGIKRGGKKDAFFVIQVKTILAEWGVLVWEEVLSETNVTTGIDVCPGIRTWCGAGSSSTRSKVRCLVMNHERLQTSRLASRLPTLPP